MSGLPERFTDVQQMLLVQSYEAARQGLDEIRKIQPGWLDGTEGPPRCDIHPHQTTRGTLSLQHRQDQPS